MLAVHRGADLVPLVAARMREAASCVEASLTNGTTPEVSGDGLQTVMSATMRDHDGSRVSLSATLRANSTTSWKAILVHRAAGRPDLRLQWTTGRTHRLSPFAWSASGAVSLRGDVHEVTRSLATRLAHVLEGPQTSFEAASAPFLLAGLDHYDETSDRFPGAPFVEILPPSSFDDPTDAKLRYRVVETPSPDTGWYQEAVLPAEPTPPIAWFSGFAEKTVEVLLDPPPLYLSVPADPIARMRLASLLPAAPQP